MAALHHFVQRVFHIVAQIVEAQLIIRGIGDVGGISILTCRVIHVVFDAFNPKAQRFMHAAHPVGIALGEIIVHCHHMHWRASQCVKVAWKCGNQCFAFTGFHF